MTVRAPPASAVALSITHIFGPLKREAETENMLAVMAIHVELIPKPGKSAHSGVPLVVAAKLKKLHVPVGSDVALIANHTWELGDAAFANTAAIQRPLSES